ncbi:hypothetical protein [Ekhidna sp.]
MRNLTLFLSFIVCAILTKAQDGVGIGTQRPDPSAVLHIQSQSTAKGLLIPRYTSTNVTNIDDPAHGLLVFDIERRVMAYYDSLYSTGGRWEYMRGVPTGAILMWSGSEVNIPDGFALCDGSIVNGLQTPNLVSTFIRGSEETSDDYTGALDVIPNLTEINDDLIYDTNISTFGTNPCSAYEFVYTHRITNSNCANPTQNGVILFTSLGNECQAEPFPSPVDCTTTIEYCISAEPNPNYYLLTPEDCLNENILLYWDVAYIMRVD